MDIASIQIWSLPLRTVLNTALGNTGVFHRKSGRRKTESRRHLSIQNNAEMNVYILHNLCRAKMEQSNSNKSSWFFI